MGERDEFEKYYRKQRRQQATLTLQPPANMHESIEGYKVYFHGIGKNHALKKYDQFALNTSWFYPSCAISRNFCYKNNE